MSYKTPGVYVKEVTVFPPSVAQVETAIPAFIGYTQQIAFEGESLLNMPTKVDSLLEFETIFGGDAAPSAITVTLNNSNAPERVAIQPRYHLFKSIQMFYANGGGKCYIVSVGPHTNAGTVAYAELRAGLDALQKYDEPTIITFPDAILLNNANELYTLHNDALAQCASLQDRVGVFDLLEARAGQNFDWEDGVDEFRNSTGINNLKYGAAYVPHLRTILPVDFSYFDVTLQDQGGLPVNLRNISPDPATLDTLVQANDDAQTIQNFIDEPDPGGNPGLTIRQFYDNFAPGSTDDEGEINDRITFIEDNIVRRILDPGMGGNLFNQLQNTNTQELFNNLVRVKLARRVQFLLQGENDFYDDPANDIVDNAPAPNTWAGGQPAGLTAAVVVPADYNAFNYGFGVVDFGLAGIGSSALPGQTIYGDDPAANLAAVVGNGRTALSGLVNLIIQDLQTLQEQAAQSTENFEADLINTNSIYASIVEAIRAEGSIVPPSGAIAGVYSAVDENRGVHKAPANVSLNAVVGPTVVIDDNDQDDLNIDVNAGKSINAIRSFTGKGTLVWGARTLAGNDNEWRYISVRRFFNMVEESIKKSTGWAVFEPNDANTWSLVRSMINNYLFEKWQEGALQGASPDEAFFVRVGEGITFTSAEKLQGIMRVKIGMAVVRPAEFIILEFSHKMVGT